MIIEIKKDKDNITIYDTKKLEIKKDIIVSYNQEDGIKIIDKQTDKQIMPKSAILNIEKIINNKLRGCHLLYFDDNVILVNVPYAIKEK